MKARVHINMVADGREYRIPVGPVEKPIGGILDPRFKYVPAVKTDVAATIARVRAEIANGERKL